MHVKKHEKIQHLDHSFGVYVYIEEYEVENRKNIKL